MTAPSPTVEQLAARVAQLTATVEDLDTLVASQQQPAAGPAGAQPPAELLYPDVVAFVEGFFIHAFARPLGGEFRWCPRWWDHVEAALRLEALWRTFEHLRLDPQTGMSVWIRDHVDNHLPRLMAPTGPFARCSQDRKQQPHVPDTVLPVTPPPAGWPHETEAP